MNDFDRSTLFDPFAGSDGIQYLIAYTDFTTGVKTGFRGAGLSYEV